MKSKSVKRKKSAVSNKKLIDYIKKGFLAAVLAGAIGTIIHRRYNKTVKPTSDPELDLAYKIFEADSTTDWEDIRKSYKNFGLKFHPDRNPDNQDGKLFRIIDNAYKIIKKSRGK